MKKKKILALLSGVGICLTANAMNPSTAIDPDVQILTTEVLNELELLNRQNEVPIYEVIFNKSWGIISDIYVDNEFVYVQKNELPESLLKIIIPSSFVKKDNKDWFRFSRSMVTSVNQDNLRLNVALGKDVIDSKLDLSYQDKTPVSEAVDAFLADYQLGYNSNDKNSYFSIDGTYFGKDKLNFTGGVGYSGDVVSRSDFYLTKTFDDNSVLRFGEGTSNQHTNFNNANVMGLKYSTAYYNEQNSDVSIFAPILPISGYSINPSSMDLFINDQLYQTYDLGVGDYNLQLPLTSAMGAGVFKTVIRDKNGLPQVIEIPFFTHNELIKKGHVEYEFSAGTLQKNSSSYSRRYSTKKYVADGIIKYGLTDEISASVFVQNTRDGSLVEGRTDFTNQYVPGLVSLGYAYNSKKQGQALIGFQSKDPASLLNYAVTYQAATGKDFCQTFIESCSKEKLNGFLSYTAPNGWGNFNFGFAKSKTERRDLKTLSFSWNKKISRKVHLNAGVYKSTGINNGVMNSGVQGNISLTINWDDKISSNHTVAKHQDYDATYVNSLYFQEDNKNPMRGFGSIQTYHKNGKNDFSGQYMNNSLPFARYYAFVDNSNSKTTFNQNLSGSFYYIPEKDYYGFTKSSDGGITLVEIENGVKGIGVLQSNKYSNSTNTKGIAVVTGTKPNTFNSVSLDIGTIPFDRPVDKLQYDFISPGSGASKIMFKMAVEPFEIHIKGAGSGGLIYINNEYYMVDKEGKSIVGYEGDAKLERSDGSICDLNLSRDKKDYVCW